MFRKGDYNKNRLAHAKKAVAIVHVLRQSKGLIGNGWRLVLSGLLFYVMLFVSICVAYFAIKVPKKW